MDIRFLGHACFELTDGDTRVLVDPFLTGNPKAAVEASELDPTHIFLTHGHVDHYGDIVEIAKRTGRSVRGDRRAGGRAGRSRAWRTSPTRTSAARWSSTAAGCALVPAWHTSTTPNGTGEHAGRPRDQPRRQDRLPPGRHLPVLRPPAGEGARSRGRRAGPDRRPLHDGPPRRRDGGGLVGADTVIPCPLQHVPADRDRRPGVQVGRRVEDLVEGRDSGAGRDALCLDGSFFSARSR